MSRHLKFNCEILIRQDTWYPNTVSDGNGSILVMVNPRTAMFSSDNGKRWSERPEAFFQGFYKCLPDKSILGFAHHNVVNDKIRRKQQHKPFICWIRRAKSLQALVSGEYEDDFCPMYIPDLDGTAGDSQNYIIGYVDHGFAVLDDGSMICTMYGRFRQDKIKVPYFPDGAYQYRSWVCISRNDGKSWEYLQTIGSNEIKSLPAISEGYCEPDIVLLPDDRLITVMRTGGSSKGGSDERYTPMVISRSTDKGQNWSIPEPLYKYGVWPHLLSMKNGLLVCTAGRPGVFVLTSTDHGDTWSEPIIVDSHDSMFGKCSSGYNCLEEISPGVLALIYDTVDRSNPKLPHQTIMRLYTTS